MSDSLTSDAPVEGGAATAPSPEAAVAGGSVDSPDVIPASRFNGLMSKYQSEKSEWEAELKATRAEVERLTAEMENNSVAETDSEVLDEVRTLKAELQAERIGRAREAAVAKYPGAAAFADMLVGTNASEIEAAAAELHKRVTALTAPADADGGASTNGDAANQDDTSTSATTDTSANPGGSVQVPVLAGGQSVDDSAAADEAITAAIKEGDFQSLWSQLRRRASESAVQGRTDLSV